MGKKSKASKKKVATSADTDQSQQDIDLPLDSDPTRSPEQTTEETQKQDLPPASVATISPEHDTGDVNKQDNLTEIAETAAPSEPSVDFMAHIQGESVHTSPQDAEQLIEEVTNLPSTPLPVLEAQIVDSHESKELATVLTKQAAEPIDMTISDMHENDDSRNAPQAGEAHTTITSLPDKDSASVSIDLQNGTERDADLRHEIACLQEALQRSKDEQDILRVALDELNQKADRLIEEKTLAESQYRGLFSKVTQMKTTLGARLKQDSEELAQNRILIEDLEAQNATLNETVSHMQEEVVRISDTSSSLSHEVNRTTSELQALKDELHKAKHEIESEQKAHLETQARHVMVAAEWENLLLEEGSARDGLHDRIHDLEEQVSAQNSAYDNLRSVADHDSNTILNLKNNLYELQEEHKTEKREIVEKLESTIECLMSEKKIAEDKYASSRLETQTLHTDLEKFRPYEQEIKEKNLLIGKLRHEAVILNEHLTKALRLLKRGTSNDSVDRQLLNNLLLSFFQIPRQDSKRFEVLKILSSVLAWDDLQKEQAGLLRPGSSTSSRALLSPSTTRSPPLSPSLSRDPMSRRASGSVHLQAADFMGPNRESMSDLWINFLQSEAATNAISTVENS